VQFEFIRTTCKLTRVVENFLGVGEENPATTAAAMPCSISSRMTVLDVDANAASRRHFRRVVRERKFDTVPCACANAVDAMLN
jgi:hypothetical protein